MADNTLASYNRVEIIALAIGLAMRNLYVTQFPDEYSGIPHHVINSPLEFREYEQLSYDIKTLIDGYDNLYVYSLLPCFSCCVSHHTFRFAQIDKAYSKIEKTPGIETQTTNLLKPKIRYVIVWIFVCNILFLMVHI